MLEADCRKNGWPKIKRYNADGNGSPTSDIAWISVGAFMWCDQKGNLIEWKELKKEGKKKNDEEIFMIITTNDRHQLATIIAHHSTTMSSFDGMNSFWNIAEMERAREKEIDHAIDWLTEQYSYEMRRMKNDFMI